MANISKCIYYDELLFDKYYNDENNGLKCGYFLSDKIIISFRGVNLSLPGNYFTCLNMLMCDYDGGKIHYGIHNQLIYSSFLEELINDIIKLSRENPKHEIYITGHSLGSALSTLFGYILSKRIDNNINIIVFSSFPLCDAELVKKIDLQKNIKYTGFVNNCDPILFVPDFTRVYTNNTIIFKHDSSKMVLSNHDVDIYLNFLYEYDFESDVLKINK